MTHPDPPPAPLTKQRSKKIGPIVVCAALALCCGGVLVGTQSKQASTNAAPEQAANAWWNGGGNTSVSALQSDLEDMQAASGNIDLAALKQACRNMQIHVQTAQAYQPFPDTQGQKWWAAGLAASARVSTDCIAGVDNVSAELIRQSGEELTEATVDFQNLAQRRAEMG